MAGLFQQAFVHRPVVVAQLVRVDGRDGIRRTVHLRHEIGIADDMEAAVEAVWLLGALFHSDVSLEFAYLHQKPRCNL